MDSETLLDRELSQYWNNLVASAEAPLPPASPPAADLITTVIRLRAMSQAPLPPEARELLARRHLSWDAPAADPGLMNGAPLALAEPATTLRQHAAGAPAWSPVSPPPARPWGRSLAQLSTVVLLLMVGLIAVGLVRRNVAPGVGPDQAIFEITLPAGTIPPGGPTTANLDYFTLNPGDAGEWTNDNGACCPGVRVTYLLAGELTVQSVAAARLYRHDHPGPAETVAPGREVVVAPGDVIVTRYDAAMTTRNAGTAPVGMLDASIFHGFTPLIDFPPGWTIHLDGHSTYGLTLPDQDLVLRLDAIDLASGASKPLPAGAITQLGITLVDAFPLHTENAGPITNPNPEPVTVHVVTLAPAADPAGG